MEIKEKIQAKISGKKVMVFAKSHCPFSKKAREILKEYIGKGLPADQIEIWDIENDPNCQAIQEELKNITGAATVSLT